MGRMARSSTAGKVCAKPLTDRNGDRVAADARVMKQVDDKRGWQKREIDRKKNCALALRWTPARRRCLPGGRGRARSPRRPVRSPRGPATVRRQWMPAGLLRAGSQSARAINGWPAKERRALSRPMRLDWPPARTKPAASHSIAAFAARAWSNRLKRPAGHTQLPTSSRKRISDSMPSSKFFRLNFSLGACRLSSGRPKPIITLGRPR